MRLDHGSGRGNARGISGGLLPYRDGIFDVQIAGTFGTPALNGSVKISEGEVDFYQVNLGLRELGLEAHLTDNGHQPFWVIGKGLFYMAPDLVAVGGFNPWVAIEDTEHRLSRIRHLISSLKLHAASLESYASIHAAVAFEAGSAAPNSRCR